MLGKLYLANIRVGNTGSDHVATTHYESLPTLKI
jgi:hypothetical protein